MSSAKYRVENRRKHRIDSYNQGPVSDCCGAPILPGGVCFECRESCEERLEESPLETVSRAGLDYQDRAVLADDELAYLSYVEEGGSGVFDEIAGAYNLAWGGSHAHR